MSEQQKTVLVAVRHSPYGSSLARAALDAALSAAAFEQPIKLLFLGDGVLQLHPDQDSSAVGIRNIGKLLSSLPLYDIESVYVDRESAQRYDLDLATCTVPVLALDSKGIRDLLGSCDHLLGF